MIKIVFNIKSHFSLIRPGMFGHQKGAQRAPQIPTIWIVWIPQNPVHMWGRNVAKVDGLFIADNHEYNITANYFR